MPLLNAPHLQELQISAIGLTHASATHLIDYLSSPRCRLRALRANGNRLGLRSLRAVVCTIHRHNFTLIKLELYTNGLADPDPDDNSETSASDEPRSGCICWQDSESELARVLHRNRLLREVTEREALSLLRYARAILRKLRRNPASASGALIPLASTSVEHPTPSQITSLPTELQLYILSFLAPFLSVAQRIRIYAYASSPATLPPLLPKLVSRENLPDPTALPAGMLLRKRKGFASNDGVVTGSKHVPSGGRKAEERVKWLTMVRCDAFELEDNDDWREAYALALRYIELPALDGP